MLLALGTSGFVGATIYLAGRLHDVRAQLAAEEGAAFEHAVVWQPEADRQVVPAQRLDAEHADARGADHSRPRDVAAALAGPETAGLASRESRGRRLQREISAAFLKRYADPAQRAVMLSEEKAILLRTTRKFGGVAGLSDHELDQFVTLLAQNKLERDAAGHACGADSECDLATYSFPDDQRHVAAVAAYLGPHRYQQYEEFREAAPERSQVDQLRLRVVDSSALRDSEAEKLISALLDERRRYLSDAAQRGLKLTTRNTSAGLVILKTGAEGNRPDYSETLRFHERLDARATQILDPEQLKAFRELQAQALRTTRSSRRAPNVSAGTPGPAGASTPR